MPEPQDITSFFSLSVDELALALYLINCPQQGRQVMAEAYENLTDEQLTYYLTAARNSLISKDLCWITPEDTLAIPENLERAVFPLKNFDRVVGVYRVSDNQPWYWDVYLNQGRDFTIHLSQLGIVHALTHGAIAGLPGMVGGLFSGLASLQGGAEKIDLTRGTQFSLILELIENPPEGIETRLVSAGWPGEAASFFAQDIQDQTLRATISKVEAGWETYPQISQQIPDDMLVVLKGPQRAWLFEYSAAAKAPANQVNWVDYPTFQQVLAGFLG